MESCIQACIGLLTLTKTALESPSQQSLVECIAVTQSLLTAKYTSAFELSLQERYRSKVGEVESILQDVLKSVGPVHSLSRVARSLFRRSGVNALEIQTAILNAMHDLFKVIEVNVMIDAHDKCPLKSKNRSESAHHIYADLEHRLDCIISSQQDFVSHDTLDASVLSLAPVKLAQADQICRVGVRRIEDPSVYTARKERGSMLKEGARRLLSGRTDKWDRGSIRICLPKLIIETDKGEIFMEVALRFAEVDKPMLVSDKHTIRIRVMDGAKVLIKFNCEEECNKWKGLISLGVKCASLTEL